MSLEFIINPPVLHELQSKPFNPPVFGDHFSEIDFDREYWQVHEGLKNVFAELGFNNSESDYCINEDFSLSRFIGVEIRNRLMVARTTVDRITGFLGRLEQSYIVFLTCDFDESTELFFVLVMHDKVIGQFEKRETARAFGFDETSGQIGPIE